MAHTHTRTHAHTHTHTHLHTQIKSPRLSYTQYKNAHPLRQFQPSTTTTHHTTSTTSSFPPPAAAIFPIHSPGPILATTLPLSLFPSNASSNSG